jgi:hypothetical protein
MASSFCITMQGKARQGTLAQGSTHLYCCHSFCALIAPFIISGSCSLSGDLMPRSRVAGREVFLFAFFGDL